jgi:hypothetical protein
MVPPAAIAAEEAIAAAAEVASDAAATAQSALDAAPCAAVRGRRSRLLRSLVVAGPG